MATVKICCTALLLFSVNLHAQDSLLYLQKEKNLTNHPANDRHPSFSPDGKQIVFESDRSGKWGIYSMAVNGGNIKPLVVNEFNNRIPSFHPGGDEIVFESDKSGYYELYSYHISQNNIRKLIAKEMFPYNQVFGAHSPNGKWLAFCSDSLKRDGPLNIYLFHVLSGKISPLTSDTARSLYPCWSATSKEIIFFSRRDTKGMDDELYRMKMKSGKSIRLTNYPLHNFCPAWSSANNFVVYASSMENIRPELFMLNLKNKKEIRLTFNSDGDTEPAISPDGKTIAWTGFRNGNFEICLMKL